MKKENVANFGTTRYYKKRINAQSTYASRNTRKCKLSQFAYKQSL
jgi:hypothetical protein